MNFSWSSISKTILKYSFSVLLFTFSADFINFSWNVILWFHFYTLYEKSPNTEFFLVRIFQYSVWIQENTDQNKFRIWTLFTHLKLQYFQRREPKRVTCWKSPTATTQPTFNVAARNGCLLKFKNIDGTLATLFELFG